MSTENNPVGAFIAWALMIAGGLIALLSGGCTLLVFGAGLLEGMNSSAGENLSILFMVLLFGGVPFIVGAVMFWAGRSMRAPKIKPPGSSPVP